MVTKLIITIDTEPDNQWDPPGLGGKLPPFSFENTRNLGRLADFFHKYNIPVTWLTSYSIVTDIKSADVLKKAQDDGDEIGGHLHGWETPPYTEHDPYHRSFIYEYDKQTRFEKHQNLVDIHEKVFGVRPVSYRAGRWGIDNIEYKHLEKLGYKITSSIAPGIDFRDRIGRTHLGPDFRHHLKLQGLKPFRVGNLIELPVSIIPVGIFSNSEAAYSLARNSAERSSNVFLPKYVSSFLSAINIQKLIWIRPFKHRAETLLEAGLKLVEKDEEHINIMFHSSEAYLGTSPFSRKDSDIKRLYSDLTLLIEGLLATGKVVGQTLRESLNV